MSDLERVVGRLEGKVDLMLSQQTEMRQELKTLHAWKWKSAGVISTIGTIWVIMSALIRLRG